MIVKRGFRDTAGLPPRRGVAFPIVCQPGERNFSVWFGCRDLDRGDKAAAELRGAGIDTVAVADRDSGSIASAQSIRPEPSPTKKRSPHGHHHPRHQPDDTSARAHEEGRRRLYARACGRFFGWCERRGLTLGTIRPFDVATWVKELRETHSTPGVKQQLAAVRILFDWLITGQVVSTNPVASVRGPKYAVAEGKTPVLDSTEWRRLLDAIPTDTVRDLRDRALIATLTYSFARVGAALKLKVEDLRSQGTGWQLHLHEKGGKEHKMPCHHALAEMLHAYIAAGGIAADRKGWLFRTSPRHNAAALSEQPMDQKDGWRMIRRRAAAAGIAAPIGNHSFRATGITNFLENGGSLENAQDMAAHASPRTTRLYDRRKDRLKQAEVERIRF
jgi:site-specific recombinase XerD